MSRNALGAIVVVVLLHAGAGLAEQSQSAGQQPAAAKPAPQPAVTALTDTGWPRAITSGTTKIVVYQPQVDSYDGFRLTARAAVAVTEKADTPPVYGIVNLSAQTSVDKDERLVTLDKMTVTPLFPGAEAKAAEWGGMVQKYASRLRPIALERFEAALAVAEARGKGASVVVKNDPPVILISTRPAMLIIVDGEPAYRDVKGTSLQRIINTRPLIVKDRSGKLYLKIFDGWMEASVLAGPWTVASNACEECDEALQEAVKEKVADLLIGGDPSDPKTAPSLKKQVPHLFVATRPAELLVFDGKPKFVPVEGTALMYAENTTGNLFINSGDQKAYILVSGRWFSGPSNLSGAWTFVAGDKLPKDFSRIPDSSPKENVRASIRGTEQAEEALIANSIPQTARVKRSEAKFEFQLDGKPQLERIESTDLHYVKNASQPIIVVGKEYFGVQNGVWFVANNIGGPWLVATTVPSVIYSIPVTSPLHYVTYVKIYDSTPEYVVVGYTPGYTGAYVSGGCVVYGTGYYYTPWVGTYWYGPPVTYGFGVSIAYTPWGGWHMGFGFGWSWGPMTVAVGWGWGAYPWWGGYYGWGGHYPYAYRPGYGAAWGPRGGYAAWGPGYWGGTTGNMYHKWGPTTAVTRRTGGYNAWTGNAWAGQAGRAYNSRTGVAAAGQRGVAGNVYTGNYASGGRGAAVNTRTGAAVAGRGGTAGNVYTGREVSAGQAVVRGPGGNTTNVGAVRGENAGALRVGDDVYAGHDGNVYKRDSSGEWNQVSRPEPRQSASQTDRSQVDRSQMDRSQMDRSQMDRSQMDRSQIDRSEMNRSLDRDYNARSRGNWQAGAARSGGYHGGFRGGGGRRR